MAASTSPVGKSRRDRSAPLPLLHSFFHLFSRDCTVNHTRSFLLCTRVKCFTTLIFRLRAFAAHCHMRYFSLASGPSQRIVICATLLSPQGPRSASPHALLSFRLRAFFAHLLLRPSSASGLSLRAFTRATFTPPRGYTVSQVRILVPTGRGGMIPLQSLGSFRQRLRGVSSDVV